MSLRCLVTLWLLLHFLLFSAVCVQSQSTCTAGDDNQSNDDESSNENFYANLRSNDRASCAGTVVAWHYCYYTDVSSGDTYEFDAAMYREQNDDDLELVSGSLRNIRLTASDIMSAGGSFVCDTLSLDEAEQFEVQVGDVVAACIRDRGGSRKALRMISVNGPGSSSVVTAGSGVCDSPNLINDNELSSQQAETVLHLYVDIQVPPPPTTMPSQEPTTTPPTTVPSEESTIGPPTTEPEPFTTSTTPSEGVTVTSTPLSQDTATSVAMSATSSSGQTGASNSGTIIAVVIVLIMTVIVASGVVIGFVMCYRRGNVKAAYTVQRKHLGAEGFENVMYSSAGLPDDYDIDYEKIPIGNIQISENVASYNVPVSSVNTSKPKFDQPLPPLPAKPDDSTLYETPLSAEASMPIYEYTEFGPDLIMNQERDIYANLRPYCVPAAVEDELYVQLKAFGIRSIRRDEIQIGSHLDSGQFGSVDQGVWRRSNDSAVDVALKTLKESASEQDKVRFLQEGAIMAQFKHPNVISLHGVVSGEPLMLVVELVNRGDLQKYLISTRSEAGNASKLAPLFLSFSRQVALGMQYLTGKKFVHRDLAARNILVSSDNVCKVADFGMSRDLADEQYYVSQGGKIPVKWTAPEALHFKKFSTASDVWSYGCLLYEIWSLGHKPFEGKTNVEVIRLVEGGYRLPPPPGCPRRVYELMMVAWNPESSRRPGFRDLLLALMMNEEEVLCIPSGHEEGSQAGVLGAPLKEGEALYPDLQRKYLSQV